MSFQLIGFATLLVAAKYSETYGSLPTLSACAALAQGLYSAEQIAEAELFVLRVLGWRCDAISHSHFIEFHRTVSSPSFISTSSFSPFSSSSSRSMSDEMRSQPYHRCVDYLNEIVLYDYSLCRVFRPSLLCEAIFQSAAVITEGCYTDSAKLCAYNQGEIRACTQRVLQFFQHLQFQERMRA